MPNDIWPSHNIAAAVVESMKRHKRKPSDFYPTPAEATTALIPMLNIPKTAWVCDPGCGEGDFIEVFRILGFNVYASDLRHTGYGDGGVDFLNPPDDRFFFSFDVIATNPPFDLAEDFIRMAHGNAGIVVMLLKSNYWNAKKRLALWDECTPTGFFPISWRLAFLEEERGKSPLMDCDFWIWDYREPKLPWRPLERPAASETPYVGQKPLTVHLRRLHDAMERLEAVMNGG